MPHAALMACILGVWMCYSCLTDLAMDALVAERQQQAVNRAGSNQSPKKYHSPVANDTPVASDTLPAVAPTPPQPAYSGARGVAPRSVLDGQGKAHAAPLGKPVADEVQALRDELAEALRERDQAREQALLASVPPNTSITPPVAYRAPIKPPPSQRPTGDVCTDCGSFNMVRAGTCLTCMNCGTTTGCS